MRLCVLAVQKDIQKNLMTYLLLLGVKLKTNDRLFKCCSDGGRAVKHDDAARCAGGNAHDLWVVDMSYNRWAVPLKITWP